MTVLKNIFSQWFKYLLWALISVVFWAWIFTLLNDAPPNRKLLLCAEVTELEDGALSAALSESKPEGIRLVAVHPFSYYLFDSDEMLSADLYIVSESQAPKYIDSFGPLEGSGLAGSDRPLWTHEGRAYGLLIYDAASGEGAAKDYIGYAPSDGEPEDYYLFFGARSAHREDGAAEALAKALLELP